MFEPKDADRFWSKVRKAGPDECWEWTAARTSHGYGVISVKGKHKLAHRVSFVLAHGERVLKRDARGFPLRVAPVVCRNRLCVNPAHLAQVTDAENMELARATGRAAFGMKYQNAKLTDDAVREIRQQAVDFDGELRMMAKYKVGQSAIKNVFARKNWGHVKD